MEAIHTVPWVPGGKQMPGEVLTRVLKYSGMMLERPRYSVATGELRYHLIMALGTSENVHPELLIGMSLGLFEQCDHQVLLGCVCVSCGALVV